MTLGTIVKASQQLTIKLPSDRDPSGLRQNDGLSLDLAPPGRALPVKNTQTECPIIYHTATVTARC